MKHCKVFSNNIVKERFKKADRLKINKKLFIGDIESAWVAGFCTAIEIIHNNHKENPYASIDEMLGDMQIIAVENFNYFNKKHANYKHKPICVEDFINEKNI